MNCPLCGETVSVFFPNPRPAACALWHCGPCDFVFKDPSARLGPAEEKSRYDSHRNGDEGHLNFLRPVVELLAKSRPAPARGLDWGSGPVPALVGLLRKAGYEAEGYDPFFGPFSVPAGLFDFITCTEAIEHFFEPAAELRAMAARLRGGGTLAIQTEIHRGSSLPEFFENWYYARDPTHVSFFGERTFTDVFPRFGLHLRAREGRVWMFVKE